jgi:hypothetical protein
MAASHTDGYHRPDRDILSQRTVRRSYPSEEPSALISARWDLCGGQALKSENRPYRDPQQLVGEEVSGSARSDGH